MVKSAGGKITVKVDADLEELIPGFLQTRRKDIMRIKGALARRDFESARILGHGIKSAGGVYGFDGIVEIGGALEQAAISHKYDELEALIDRMKDYLQRLQIIFEEVE